MSEESSQAALGRGARGPLYRNRSAPAVATLAFFAALIAWLTWPLATHLETHLPNTVPFKCQLDTVYMVWMLAGECHALATDPTGILEANIFHPAHHARFYGDTGFGALPYFASTYGLTGNPTTTRRWRRPPCRGDP